MIDEIRLKVSNYWTKDQITMNHKMDLIQQGYVEHLL